MRLVPLAALAVLVSVTAQAQTARTDSAGVYAGIVPLGFTGTGVAADVLLGHRWMSGLDVGLRGGYEPAGSGSYAVRAGATLGLVRPLRRRTTARAEVAALVGRYRSEPTDPTTAARVRVAFDHVEAAVSVSASRTVELGRGARAHPTLGVFAAVDQTLLDEDARAPIPGVEARPWPRTSAGVGVVAGVPVSFQFFGRVATVNLLGRYPVLGRVAGPGTESVGLRLDF